MITKFCRETKKPLVKKTTEKSIFYCNGEKIRPDYIETNLQFERKRNKKLEKRQNFSVTFLKQKSSQS